MQYWKYIVWHSNISSQTLDNSHHMWNDTSREIIKSCYGLQHDFTRAKEKQNDYLKSDTDNYLYN